MTMLAPDIVEAIFEAASPASEPAHAAWPPDLLPRDWGEQRRLLGFDALNPVIPADDGEPYYTRRFVNACGLANQKFPRGSPLRPQRFATRSLE